VSRLNFRVQALFGARFAIISLFLHGIGPLVGVFVCFIEVDAVIVSVAVLCRVCWVLEIGFTSNAFLLFLDGGAKAVLGLDLGSFVVLHAMLVVVLIVNEILHACVFSFFEREPANSSSTTAVTDDSVFVSDIAQFVSVENAFRIFVEHSVGSLAGEEGVTEITGNLALVSSVVGVRAVKFDAAFAHAVGLHVFPRSKVFIGPVVHLVNVAVFALAVESFADTREASDKSVTTASFFCRSCTCTK